MRTWSCIVRLAGSRNNEVRKSSCSAAEIILLRSIHGQDAVHDIREAPDNGRSHEQERAWLAHTYASARDSESGKAWVSFLFGPSHQELPTTLPAMPRAPVDVEDLVDNIAA